MTKTKFCFALMALLAFSGCDFSPAGLQASAKKDDNATLEDQYYLGGPQNPAGQAAQQELIARAVIPAGDWAVINQHQVAVGMGPDSVIASWGPPSDVNTTTTANGQDVQWVYRSCDTCNASYVYFTNNIVATIQN